MSGALQSTSFSITSRALGLATGAGLGDLRGLPDFPPDSSSEEDVCFNACCETTSNHTQQTLMDILKHKLLKVY